MHPLEKQAEYASVKFRYSLEILKFTGQLSGNPADQTDKIIA